MKKSYHESRKEFLPNGKQPYFVLFLMLFLILLKDCWVTPKYEARYDKGILLAI